MNVPVAYRSLFYLLCSYFLSFSKIVRILLLCHIFDELIYINVFFKCDSVKDLVYFPPHGGLCKLFFCLICHVYTPILST